MQPQKPVVGIAVVSQALPGVGDVELDPLVEPVEACSATSRSGITLAFRRGSAASQASITGATASTLLPPVDRL
jgi:hypothetical protein